MAFILYHPNQLSVEETMKQIILTKQHSTEQCNMLQKSLRQSKYIKRTENCYGISIFSSWESNCFVWPAGEYLTLNTNITVNSV